MSRVAAEPLTYRRRGRSRAALVTVAAIWLALIMAIVLVDAAPWLMACLGAFTLPALWELIVNPAAGMTLDQQGISWFSGKREASATWNEIEKVRLDTRLDFSVRATLMLTTGQKIRLPYECTPDHNLLEAALNAQGIRTERHHFSLIG